ncbi:MAG: beta-ketoacyl synthase chain length factor [Lysobacteraceae bacterium]|nr:beta-ketoacyl synthase chain length factor [Xanthomonadaceae bacterium]HRX98968.1 beta-ketoacyl synthase chain length factor [Xanthomonadaceae bacterium]
MSSPNVMSPNFRLHIDGIATWASGLPDWPAMRAFARGEAELVDGTPRRPAPDLLPANERRRAPDTVLLALQVAQAACIDADADPKALPSIFASTHGDLAITDYMCATLAGSPTDLSPTKFHNSVHNAAAGYWTIGCGCHAATTAISAHRATLAQGLIEAALQLAAGASQVLLVAYDGPSTGPLGTMSQSEGLLGLGLVLSPHSATGNNLRLALQLGKGADDGNGSGRLETALSGNAMAPALKLLDAIATGRDCCLLPAGRDTVLKVGIGA